MVRGSSGTKPPREATDDATELWPRLSLRRGLFRPRREHQQKGARQRGLLGLLAMRSFLLYSPLLLYICEYYGSVSITSVDLPLYRLYH